MTDPWYRRLFSSTRVRNSESARSQAASGNAEAQFGLGLRYGSGAGEALDFPQAAQWYRKAAEQNHSMAQFNLSVMYSKGQGVPQDETEALVWLRKGAESGDAGAQFTLGTRYHRASLGELKIDPAESRIEAYKWFSLAAKQGYINSDANCERVALTMSREEIKEGNERASLFGSAPSTAQALQSNDSPPTSI